MNKFNLSLICAYFLLLVNCFPENSSRVYSLDEKVRNVLQVSSAAVIGSVEFNRAALKSLQTMGSRKDLLETVVSRAERIELGVEISVYASHIFFVWRDGLGSEIVEISVQIALDKAKVPKEVFVSKTCRPAPDLGSSGIIISPKLVPPPPKE